MYSSFNAVPFDWGRGQPQKVRKAGADYYSGTIVLYSQVTMDALWALRVVVNVTPIGDGTQRVYIDSWQDPTTIQHTLIMQGGTEAHVAILTDLQWDERLLSGGTTGAGPGYADRVFNARAEFLLLS